MDATQLIYSLQTITGLNYVGCCSQVATQWEGLELERWSDRGI